MSPPATVSPHRTDSTADRSDAIASRFLRYLYQERGFRPAVAGFLDSGFARALTPPVSPHELAQSVARLEDHQLIVTGGTLRQTGPFRAGLTGSGLRCVAEHNADLREWTRAATTRAETAHEPSEIPQQPSASGGYALGGLARVARVLLLTLPAVRSCEDDKESVEQTALKLLNSAAGACPDPQRTRLLAQRLRTELSTGSLSHTLGAVLLDSLDDAMAESGLT